MRLFLPGLLLLATSGMSQSPATLTVDVSKPIGNVSPTLYGIMTEEINYSYDGGLYAELVSNRTFQTNKGPNLEHWTLIQNGSARADIAIDRTTGPSTAITHSLKFTATSAHAKSQAGFYNTGFWGIPLHAATSYQGSFYAKADGPSLGDLTVRLVNDDSGIIAASTIVPTLSSSWQKHDFTLKTANLTTSAKNHLEILAAHPGTAWFTLISLFPPTYKNEPNGKRIDLMEKLAAMHPAFLRFPGGNYLEGDHVNEHYEWKKSVGPLVDRPTHPTPWTYRSSDGIGLLEFLTWCEDLHMDPLLAVYSGYSLTGDHVTPGKDLEPYIQDALDEIDYVSGDISTRWGAQRAKDGHPAPFSLNRIEIGNEEYHDDSGTYNARFAQFYKAIKQKHPALQLVAAAPVTSVRPDILDDNDHTLRTHFYRTAQQFFVDTHRYDTYDRNGPKILVGEWATREGSPTTNLGAALGDAAWMTGLERNSDIVIMASYAPLFTNVTVGAMQWPNDLIGYDALTSYGSPSYYAQVMFTTHLGDQILASTLDTTNPRLFDSATYDSKTHHLNLKLVNASSLPQTVEIKLNGAAHIRPRATVTTLSGKTTQETNSITDPTRIVPVVSTITNAAATFSHSLPQYSIQVLDIELN
ncbi:alpha-L-arabinofuranosidase C-terminal domain-containing protein [Granulicella arctica]|uniref:alpha-L-arabinofuranosidase C-terminal domain-containing protein n=1 Tax=Granulicella arctica TaxID=940613 RepID=UPI0021E0AD1A|nr:alpha-L-arabinofuranosidase C-terminal domain-containing protein [Granulicella arctica]